MLVGLFGGLLAAQGPPKFSFWRLTSRQKGLWSAKIERLEAHNLVLEAPDLILQPPRTHFEFSGTYF